MNRIVLSFSSYSIKYQYLNPAADWEYMLMRKKLTRSGRSFQTRFLDKQKTCFELSLTAFRGVQKIYLAHHD